MFQRVERRGYQNGQNRGTWFVNEAQLYNIFIWLHHPIRKFFRHLIVTAKPEIRERLLFGTENWSNIKRWLILIKREIFFNFIFVKRAEVMQQVTRLLNQSRFQEIMFVICNWIASYSQKYIATRALELTNCLYNLPGVLERFFENELCYILVVVVSWLDVEI